MLLAIKVDCDKNDTTAGASELHIFISKSLNSVESHSHHSIQIVVSSYE